MCGLDEAGLTVERLRLALVPETGFTKTGIEPVAGLRRSPAIVTSSAASTRVLDVLGSNFAVTISLSFETSLAGKKLIQPSFGSRHIGAHHCIA